MRNLIVINLIALGVVMIALFAMLDLQTFLIALAIVAVMVASGSLTAYLWFKRGKVYEERGESGPDD